jgi:hypothetical protein
MTDHFRHHRAVQIVFVETPAAGSPAPLHRGKPGPYPRQERGYWRPANKPPRLSKAQRIVRLMRELAEREADARSMLRPDAARLRAWFANAA